MSILDQLAELKALEDKRTLLHEEMKSINDRRESETLDPEKKAGLTKRFGNLVAADAKLEEQMAKARTVDPADIDEEMLEAGSSSLPGDQRRTGAAQQRANPLAYSPRALDEIQDAIVTRAYKQVAADFKEGR